MVQSSLATKSQSFDLVKGEIEQTIKQAVFCFSILVKAYMLVDPLTHYS